MGEGGEVGGGVDSPQNRITFTILKDCQLGEVQS